MKNELLLNFNTLKNNYNELRSLCDSYERELRQLRDIVRIINEEEDIKQQEKRNKATKADIFGIIDYLHNGLDAYINNPAGRPYDDDDIINMNEWLKRSCVWLNQQIKEMQ